MIVHLLDGTYELFRHFYGLRRFTKDGDPPFGAVIGVLHTVLEMIETGATHIGVATDHVIESFRNQLWPAYKTGEGIEPALLRQFHPLEDALAAMGVAVWPMIDLEADDGLASAAEIARADTDVQKVCIWTPDKDLAQCVREDRVVQVDRRGMKIRDAEGVREKFGVVPALIPDFLALVGDPADGYPGIPGPGRTSRETPTCQFLKTATAPSRHPGTPSGAPVPLQPPVPPLDRCGENNGGAELPLLAMRNLAIPRLADSLLDGWIGSWEYPKQTRHAAIPTTPRHCYQIQHFEGEKGCDCSAGPGALPRSLPQARREPQLPPALPQLKGQVEDRRRGRIFGETGRCCGRHGSSDVGVQRRSLRSRGPFFFRRAAQHRI